MIVPKPLIALWSFAAGIVVVVGLLGSLALWSQIHGKAQPPFDVDQRAYLNVTYPNGTYVSDSTYRWCDGGQFWYTDPSSQKWNLGQSCIDLPRRR